MRALCAAGFEDVALVRRHPDLYQGVPVPSSALEFGTHGVTLRARRPRT
jgi:hypothetical protein